jgi:hypothetical protein
MSQLDTVVIATDTAKLNGGIAKVAITEAAGLVAAGLRVIFFAPNGPVDPGLAASGAEVVCLDEPDVLDDPNRLRAMGRGIWNRGAARALREVLCQSARNLAPQSAPKIDPLWHDESWPDAV